MRTFLNRFLIISALALALFLPGIALAADATLILNAVATTATSSCPNNTLCDVSQATDTKIHIYSTAGATATVVIEQANLAAGPWFVSATITNPATTGELWSIPRTPYARVRVTAYTSGNISATLFSTRGNSQIY